MPGNTVGQRLLRSMALLPGERSSIQQRPPAPSAGGQVECVITMSSLWQTDRQTDRVAAPEVHMGALYFFFQTWHPCRLGGGGERDGSSLDSLIDSLPFRSDETLVSRVY